MNLPKALAALLALITFFAFVNSLGGEFVYDDGRQILMNPLIQQPTLYGKALTSDVWAFKGDGTISASNYYRPIFVLWLIANFALFGANPFGWHILNVFLHIIVCLLSFDLLKRLGFSAGISFALAAIFAVHPVHVENVSWISGSPDVLLSLFFLSSLLLSLQSADRKSSRAYVGSVLLYLLALGTKEIAIVLFPLYFLCSRFETRPLPVKTRPSVRDAVMWTIPYAALALGFFVIRLYILGGITHSVEDAPTLSESLLSVPSVFFFYLTQALFPVNLAENYPLRPYTEFTAKFVLLTIAVVGVSFLVLRISRKNGVRQFGTLLFFLPLLPVLFIYSFPSEQIVHDRYLYLPLLGLLILFGSLASEFLPARFRARRGALLVTGVVIVLLFLQTIVYNRVWSSNLNLWEYNVKTDPDSASTLASYAAEISSHGRYGDAISVYDRSLEIKETPLAFMARARNLIALGRYSEATDNTNRIINLPNEKVNAYILYQAYETAAIAYTSSNRLNEAEALILNARERLPIYSAALTDKLAIILYNQGKKDDALKELNSVRVQARRELLPASKAVFLRLGMLEAETGDVAAAKRDLTDFLGLTPTFSDPESLNLRKQASAALARIR